VTNYTSPEDVVDRLIAAGLGCVEPRYAPTSSGPPAEGGICGRVVGGLFGVLIFADSDTAENQFRERCSGSEWSFFREGQTWRAILDGGDTPVPEDAAREVADALETDAIAGCGSE